jgi:hypothetical protein
MMDHKHGDKEYGSLKEVSKRSYGLRGLKRVIREKGSAILLKMLSMALRIGAQTPEYESVDDGDRMTIEWAEQGLNLCCCDCGLVHFIDFEVVDSAIIMTFWRNEEETEKARKRKRVTIKEVIREGDGT